MNHIMIENRILQLKKDTYNQVVAVNCLVNEADYCFTPNEYMNYMKSAPSFVQQWLFIWVTDDIIINRAFWNYIHKEISIFSLKYVVPKNTDIHLLQDNIPSLRMKDVCFIS